MNEQTIGFIILRHVNNEKTNLYWQKCYNSVRQFYPENEIIIIDDNSRYEYIKHEELYKVKIIQSKYHGRGELLPYYYYLTNKLFDIAFIIHDSVFIQKHIDLHVDKYQFTWDFGHAADEIEYETKIIKLFNDDKLLKFYQNQSLWNGCFGAMTTITHDFLTQVNNKYDLSLLLDVILTRYDRMCFERIIACLLQIEAPQKTRFGNIHNYMPWETTYDDAHLHTKLPLLKVWTGR
jgi:glycosyltransferase involved in cell wall biosynthesis